MGLVLRRCGRLHLYIAYVGSTGRSSYVQDNKITGLHEDFTYPVRALVSQALVSLWCVDSTSCLGHLLCNPWLRREIERTSQVCSPAWRKLCRAGNLSIRSESVAYLVGMTDESHIRLLPKLERGVPRGPAVAIRLGHRWIRYHLP